LQDHVQNTVEPVIERRDVVSRWRGLQLHKRCISFSAPKGPWAWSTKAPACRLKATNQIFQVGSCTTPAGFGIEKVWAVSAQNSAGEHAIGADDPGADRTVHIWRAGLRSGTVIVTQGGSGRHDRLDRVFAKALGKCELS
jgi:hypothetical protein